MDRVRIRVFGSLARDDLSEGNGLAEVRIAGLRVRERLRPPTLAETALRGADLARTGLTYLFSRTTGDRPFRRDAAPRPPRIAPLRDNEDPDARRVRNAQDPETELSRSFRPPARRDWTLDAWASISPRAADSALDRLAGMRSRVRLTSSGRFQGLARYRASGAFDGDPTRAWVADRLGGTPPWIGWETPRPTRIDRLQVLTAVQLPAGRPTVVRLRSERGVSERVALGPTEEVVLPRPLTGRRFRLEILAAEQFRGGRGDTPRTVAIADIVGLGVPNVRLPSRGALRFDCRAASVRAGGAEVGLRPAGTVADLEAGRPLRARGCGRPLPLAAAGQRLTTTGRLVRLHHLRLRSPAPDGLPRAGEGGAVLDPGRTSRGRHEDVRVRVDGPAWLVLGESFNRGWRAECDGRDLGEPVVVDGYANGWRPPRDCRSVELSFGPQRAVSLTYWLSGAACLALLAYLLLARGRRRSAPVPDAELAVTSSAERWALRGALLAGVLAAAVFGFAFSLRAGLAIGPGVALVLWLGVPVRVLVAAACGLLAVVVPAIYLIFPPDDRGGYNPGYPLDVLGAHWVGVAAFVLLFLALARSLRTARAPRDAPVPWPTAATAPRARP